MNEPALTIEYWFDVTIWNDDEHDDITKESVTLF